MKKQYPIYLYNELNLDFSLTGIKSYHFYTKTDIEENGENRQNLSERLIEVSVSDTSPHGSMVILKYLDVKITLEKELRKMELLINELADIYSLLIVKVNKSGDITGLENMDEIQAKWKMLKKKIREEYDGYEVQDFLAGVDRKINTPGSVLNELKSYPFYGILFNGIYTRYDNFKQLERVREILTISGKQQVEETLRFEYEEDGIAWLSLKGKVLHGTNSGDYQLNRYEGYYGIDTGDHWIKEAKLTMEEESSLLRKVTVFMLNQIV